MNRLPPCRLPRALNLSTIYIDTVLPQCGSLEIRRDGRLVGVGTRVPEEGGGDKSVIIPLLQLETMITLGIQYKIPIQIIFVLPRLSQ